MKKNYNVPVADVISAKEEQKAIEEPDPVIFRIATSQDAKYAYIILKEMIASAHARGTGIGYRPVESIYEKMDKGEAVIALTENGIWAGFCYIEVWEHGRFVSNSGMIVSPEFRERGVAHAIKKQIIALCRRRYPQAHIFSITSSAAIMKLNTKFGFVPVSFAEITKDKNFWHKCRHCVNYDILQGKNFKNCLCTAMLYDFSEQEDDVRRQVVASHKLRLLNSRCTQTQSDLRI
jgi:GNAT superfamily N-acetyltransferase